jgi:Family of unknown function (DUF6356)
MDKFKQAFTEHPGSVGETWGEHAQMSLGFALRLQQAALAALVHAVFPFLCVKTGSGIISDLHTRMLTNRARKPSADTDIARA